MILLLFVFSLFPIDASQDTVNLEEIEVHAPEIDRYAQGQKVINWSKNELDIYQGKALADLLQEQSPVFVRQYGAGMLASPSFRGTSAGHTAIFWNGIPINSPSLGQSDLSILPISALDQVSLQFGNSGALFGNEAIGGSIHLETASNFGNGLQVGLLQQIGSFGLFNTHLTAGISTTNFSSTTRFYRDYSKNNFPYKDLGQIGTPEVKEDHARFEQYGLVQDLSWNLREKNQLKAALWWNKTNREIQPVMGSHTKDEQEDQSIRVALDYFHFGANSIWNVKTGFVQDENIFNESLNLTRQYFLAGDWDQTFSEKWNTKLGIRYTFSLGELSTYHANDKRLELYQSTRFNANKNLAFSLNLRQLIYSGTVAPFTPSLGMDWKFWDHNMQYLQVKASLGKGFKVPTLNDRFWVPGGNPDLIPEESLSAEFGLNWSLESKISWSQTLTYYQMSVDNWITWLPKGNVWTPENIKKVHNQGIEYQGEVSGEIRQWAWEIHASYTWSKAITKAGISETDPAIGKQLAYTPEHQANALLRVNRSGFASSISTYRVGERSVTADNPRLMPAYQLFNLNIGYTKLALGETQFPISFQINNLFNTDYQALYLRAMPGRSYQFNLSIQL